MLASIDSPHGLQVDRTAPTTAISRPEVITTQVIAYSEPANASPWGALLPG